MVKWVASLSDGYVIACYSSIAAALTTGGGTNGTARAMLIQPRRIGHGIDPDIGESDL